MRESVIEKEFVQRVKTHGGLTRKFTSPNHKGVPDRIYIREGKTYFIEFKSTIGLLSASQIVEHRKYLDNGVTVYVIDSLHKINKFFEENLNAS